MEITAVLRGCRRQAGWSLRRIAHDAETSHATVSAYEQGRVSPTLDTMARIVEASGHRLEVRLEPIVAHPMARGRELVAVLDLAAQFPARHERRPAWPVFGRRPSRSAPADAA